MSVDQGDSAVLWHIDEDVAVTPEAVRAADPAFEHADAVLVTFELPASAIRETISAARRNGCRILVQPAPVPAESAGTTSLPWDQVDVLVPNEIEARALLDGGAGLPADDLADALAGELGVPTVVVTLGSSGCVAHVHGETHRYPVQGTNVVDATGASGAFMAGLAARLAAGATPVDAIQAALSAAGLAVQRAGGHESMPFPRDSAVPIILS